MSDYSRRPYLKGETVRRLIDAAAVEMDDPHYVVAQENTDELVNEVLDAREEYLELTQELKRHVERQES